MSRRSSGAIRVSLGAGAGLACALATGPSRRRREPVPAGQLIVRGDAPCSQDSRHLGYVPTEAVLGTVVLAFGGRKT